MPGGLGGQALLPQSFFCVLEGGEGSGKSSVISSLSEVFGSQVVFTREPGGTPEGVALRALLLSAEGFEWEPGAELLLMTAARVQHVRKLILPALTAGRVVVCDRFLGSTLAYQGAGRGISAALIRQLHAELVHLLPDLTIFLDVDPLIGLARSRRRLGEGIIDEGRFEAMDLAFHQRVRADFLAQAKSAPSRSAVVDASRPLPLVSAEVVALIKARTSIG